jgi:hypothetical protein
MTDDEADTVPPAYQCHLQTLNLPPSVQDLSSLNPHDAHILDVQHEPSVHVLRLRLRCGDLQVGYFDALLIFSGVIIQSDHLARLIEAKRPAKFEILYDEVDRSRADRFEYRLLLDPAFEVEFQFTDIDIVRQPVMDRRTR